MARIQELEAAVEEMGEEIYEEEERSRLQDQAKICELETRVAELQREKAGLLERQETLLERYRTGLLVRCSRTFMLVPSSSIGFAPSSPMPRKISLRCRSKTPAISTSKRQLLIIRHPVTHSQRPWAQTPPPGTRPSCHLPHTPLRPINAGA